MKESKDEKWRNKGEGGITLIALVVTIIILLILAGISINMLTGDNNIINKAQEAAEATVHASILESLQLQQTDYYIDKTTGDTTLDFIGYLQAKSIIGEEVEEGKWQINVKELMGTEQTIGNGDYLTDGTDVYMLETEDVSTGSLLNVKIASTVPLKIASTTANGNTSKYKIVYYGKDGNAKTVVGSIEDSYSSQGLSDLEKLSEYFIGKNDEEIIWNVADETGDWGYGSTTTLEDESIVTVVCNDLLYVEEYDSAYIYILYNNSIYKLTVDTTTYTNVEETRINVKDIDLTTPKAYTFSQLGEDKLFVIPDEEIFIIGYDDESIRYNFYTYFYDDVTGEFLYKTQEK